MPEEVKTATNNYRAEHDILGDYIADEMTVDASLQAKASPTYQRYRARTQQSGEEPVSPIKRFG
jgi:hypothetical protein